MLGRFLGTQFDRKSIWKRVGRHIGSKSDPRKALIPQKGRKTKTSTAESSFLDSRGPTRVISLQRGVQKLNFEDTRVAKRFSIAFGVDRNDFGEVFGSPFLSKLDLEEGWEAHRKQK